MPDLLNAWYFGGRHAEESSPGSPRSCLKGVPVGGELLGGDHLEGTSWLLGGDPLAPRRRSHGGKPWLHKGGNLGGGHLTPWRGLVSRRPLPLNIPVPWRSLLVQVSPQNQYVK
ncbi:hypothetical protein Acr_02g0014210 [Actinidia rufa]|uniref:Uncharacterized protein n=1 Tax=Actinidia rufa TaxID=165716 RepID=A0A7J0E9K6_9ERIC|nr:hypothetical protein Acr_02g0014210 [Actinidia rufa]